MNFVNSVGTINPKKGTFTLTGYRPDQTLPMREQWSRQLKGMPYAGITITTEEGDSGTRISGGRIVAGAVLLGPVGALIGGFARKNHDSHLLCVEFPDGEVAMVEVPKKKTADLKRFVSELTKWVAASTQ